MSSDNRKRFLKDAANNTFINKHETFRSMTTDQKTSVVDRLPGDIYAETHQQMKGSAIVIKSKPQYLTPMRLRPQNEMLI